MRTPTVVGWVALTLGAGLGLASCDSGAPGGPASGQPGSGGGMSSSPGTGGAGGALETSGPPHLYDVTFFEGAYVTVGGYGDPSQPSSEHRGVVLRSSDGTNWKLVHDGSQEAPRAVAHGNGIWMAAGISFPEAKGLLLRSNDGITWHQVDAPASNGFDRIVWTGSRFLLVGGDLLFESADGDIWMTRENPFRLKSFAVGRTMVVAAGLEALYGSRDGGSVFTDLGVVPPTMAGQYPYLPSVRGLWANEGAFEASVVYTCCAGETADSTHHYALTSTDGTTWTTQSTTSGHPQLGIGKGGTSVGQVQFTKGLQARTPSMDWTVVYDKAVFSAFAVGDRFVAVGWDTTVPIVSSADGITWTPADSIEVPKP